MKKKRDVVVIADGTRVISARVPVAKVFRKHWLLLLMLLPAVVYVLLFCYVPMSGLVLAFEKYQFRGGIYHSPWVGLQNFQAILIDGKLPGVTRNTILYNFAFIFLGVIFEMGSAILINELRNKYFKKVAQSFMFLPYFISWVVAGAIMYNIFNYERGIWNSIALALGGSRVDVYNMPGVWPFILIFLKLWKQTGYGSVVYLAAITGMDQEMFEAADIGRNMNSIIGDVRSLPQLKAAFDEACPEMVFHLAAQPLSGRLSDIISAMSDSTQSPKS